jgi:mono/diheme cytochrome c family protein
VSRRAALGLAAVLLAAACDREVGVPNREYMPDMVDSVPYDSFAPNPNTRDGRTLLAPPRGSVPRGFEPLHFAAGPEEARRAGERLDNPLPDNELTQKRGETVYLRFCSPCHGPGGEGDGLVARKFPRPPSLTAPHARALPDGQLFHIATFGQGVMPGHGQQVAPLDRWAIVQHVRRLQAAASVAPAAPPAAPSTEGASP